jgi:hypothetical protein
MWLRSPWRGHEGYRRANTAIFTVSHPYTSTLLFWPETPPDRARAELAGENGESDQGSWEMTVWQTTVDQLLQVFRDALRALVPHVERVRIEWRDDSSYDDWDAIAQTLYEKIVVSSLLWSMPEKEREHHQLPDYNMAYTSYEGKTVIAVNRTSSRDRLVFHSFATEKDPFDKVRVCKVQRDGRVSGDFVLLDADTATYRVETSSMTLVDLAVDI